MEAQNHLKAALYIRVSTEEQALDGLSASAQAETLKQYCNAFGMEVFDTFMDLGLSGKSLKDRRELKRLLEACSRRQFDIVLVWKISRLSRNLKDLLFLIDTFERNNVHFASCSEKFDTSTPVGRMTLQLLGSIAEFERNTIIENVKLGLKEFARKGGKASAVLGYDNLNKTLQLNESEAKIVRLIFDMYLTGSMSFSAIANYLNGIGYRTKRGHIYRSSSISYILRNPVYIGINRHAANTENEYSVEGSHSAIIDMETWSRTQSLICKSGKNRNYTDCRSELSLIQVNCLKCGSGMKIFYTGTKGRKYKYLRCPGCSNYTNTDKLIKKIYAELSGIANDEALLMTAYKRIYEHNTSDLFSENLEIASFEHEIKRLQRSKERYLKLFENYKLSDTKAFIDRIEEIEMQLQKLYRRKTQIGNVTLYDSTKADVKMDLEEFRNRLSNFDELLMKQLMSHFIKEVYMFKDDIRIVLYQ